MESIRDRVIRIICEQLNVDRKRELSNETHLHNDLGADSLDAVELVMELEDEFAIRIDDEEADKIQTVGQAVALVEAKAAGQ